jgi:predicted GIY-YIG superfamily endonuclease
MITIEKNPVKIAYYDYIMMKDSAEVYIRCAKSLEKRTAKFSEEQMKQYIHLIDGTLDSSQVKDEVK